jgi:hypothetical protein
MAGGQHQAAAEMRLGASPARIGASQMFAGHWAMRYDRLKSLVPAGWIEQPTFAL